MPKSQTQPTSPFKKSIIAAGLLTVLAFLIPVIEGSYAFFSKPVIAMTLGGVAVSVFVLAYGLLRWLPSRAGAIVASLVSIVTAGGWVGLLMAGTMSEIYRESVMPPNPYNGRYYFDEQRITSNNIKRALANRKVLGSEPLHLTVAQDTAYLFGYLPTRKIRLNTLNVCLMDNGFSLLQIPDILGSGYCQRGEQVEYEVVFRSISETEIECVDCETLGLPEHWIRAEDVAH